MYTRLWKLIKTHGRKFQNGSVSDFCNADLDNWNYDGRNFGLYHQAYECDMQAE